MNWFSSRFDWQLHNEIVKFMANVHDFQRTLETLWMAHILADNSCCDCRTELFQKISLIKMKIFESDSLTYRVMEKFSR